MYGSVSEALAESLRKTTKEQLDVHSRSWPRELTEKGEGERVVEEGETVVCVRCGVEVPDGKGPGSKRICRGAVDANLESRK